MNWDTEADVEAAAPARDIEMHCTEAAQDNESAHDTDPAHDTELTLGPTALFLVCSALVMLCGTCFVLGYIVGGFSAASAPIQTARRAVESVATLPAKVKSKSAVPMRAAPQQQASSDAMKRGAGRTQGANSDGTPAAKPSTAAGTTPSSTSLAKPLMVQVAAIAVDKDADVLVGTLRKHGYVVSIRREGDHLIHVRTGPFTSRADALAMKQRLVRDGYTAVIQ